ncbi:hypothetical protein ACS0TY_003530 [Phlomoides rotata]
MEVNCLNKKGLTPLDCIISEGCDCEIEEMLSLAGGTRGAKPSQNLVIEQGDRPKSATKKLQDYFKYDKIRESPSKARNTYIAGDSCPDCDRHVPGGVWQDDQWPDAAKNNTPHCRTVHHGHSQ